MAMLVEDITTNTCYYFVSLKERKIGEWVKGRFLPGETVSAFLFNPVQDFVLSGHGKEAICFSRHLLVPGEESAGGITRSLMKTQDVAKWLVICGLSHRAVYNIYTLYASEGTPLKQSW